MPDPYFSAKAGESEVSRPLASSRVTAVIELIDFMDLVKEENIDLLNRFYHNLSEEIYLTRKQNYCLGLRVLEPEMQIFSERIILTSPLFLEKNLPELTSITFKLFVDFCNLLLSIAIKNEIAIKGIADTGVNYRGIASSGSMSRAESKESMVLSDMLEVFSFEEVFPEGFGQKIMPPANIPYFYGEDISTSIRNLDSVKDIGIFMPLEIMDNEFAELAVYSDMLLEKKVGRSNMYACNWKNWVERKADEYSVDEILENISYLTEAEDGSEEIWKRFLEKYKD